eukprot:3089236-Amphidinium_carterae.1
MSVCTPTQMRSRLRKPSHSVRESRHADTVSDMKRPFDISRDMPTHVVHNLEVRDLPTLPRNLDWCYPELNMNAQIGMFPLNFQKELMTYYDESIAYMCDTPEDYRKMQHFYTSMDVPCGSPDDLEIPSQVRVDWSRWAHERPVNEGYSSEDSQKWLLEKDLDWKVLEKGIPHPRCVISLMRQMVCFRRTGQTQTSLMR